VKGHPPSARRVGTLRGFRAVGATLAGVAALVAGGAREVRGDCKVSWHPERPGQGDVVHIVVETKGEQDRLRGFFLDRELRFFKVAPGSRASHALAGIDYAQAPGTYELRIFSEGEVSACPVERVGIPVRAKEFAQERLTLPEHMVTLSPENVARVEREQKLFSNVFAAVTPERLWDGPFSMPVKGTLGSPFGMRRIINAYPRSPHTGVDIKAMEGTPVAASNRGRVVLVGSFFFAGNAVCIDHGEGVYTMYFHLSETCVREGDVVDKGGLIGRVGATGRAQGPHLHWGVRIMGARVDPLTLVEATSVFPE
jgi:murein DD-endopeptidase MepM/ murein hydrolase activator NlpD